MVWGARLPRGGAVVGRPRGAEALGGGRGRAAATFSSSCCCSGAESSCSLSLQAPHSLVGSLGRFLAFWFLVLGLLSVSFLEHNTPKC